MPSPPHPVRIHYHRPPDRLTIFRQWLVHDDGRVKVTLARSVDLGEPLRIEGRTVLDTGADAVWFTFPGRWHDIGRFHRLDGTFTGIYANVITPCIFEPGGEWYTTDLFLDLWIPESRSGSPIVLDEDELAQAERDGLIPAATASRARDEADRLAREAAAGTWPPACVSEWTLGRCRAVLDAARTRFSPLA